MFIFIIYPVAFHGFSGGFLFCPCLANSCEAFALCRFAWRVGEDS